MLPKKNRLSKRDDYGRVYRSGMFFPEKNLTLKVLPNKTQESRIGFVVGAKFSKLATERNRTKRQLRALFMDFWPKIREGYDVVVGVQRKKDESLAAISWKSQLEKILWRAKLIK